VETHPYLALRRAWGEYVRLREERARLKVLVAHQLYGLFPEFLRVWADLLQPGALAVLRTGLTPAAMAALSLTEFVAQVRAHRAGHRIWRFKLAQVHREAAQSLAPLWRNRSRARSTALGLTGYTLTPWSRSTSTTRPSGRSIAAHSSMPCARHSSSCRPHSLNPTGLCATMPALARCPC